MPISTTGPSRPVLERRVTDLHDRTFDVIVVGGGIVGACAALDSATRGLDVALIDRGDFGHGTSGNSLKIVHGGLRYLQRLDLRRMRESIRERRTWFRVAPHLVDPLPVVVPTYGFGMRNRRLMQLALAVNDAVSFDRNHGTAPDRRLPAGRVLSPGEVLARVPEVPRAGLTGGVVFYDGLMYSPERLTLEVVKAAARHGAVVLNYVGFRDRIWERQGLAGIVAEDLVGNDSFPVRARAVINAAGPGVEFVGSRLLDAALPPPTTWSIAVNVLVRGLGHSAAFALGERVDGAGTGRQLFFVPWRGRTMIGTGHYPYTGDPARLRNSEVESATATFLEEVNRAWPGERPFTRDDVILTHRGLLPARRLTPQGSVLLLNRQRIIDHARHGVPGAFTVLAVKYTTGRRVAEQVVDRVCRFLGHGDGRPDPDRFAAAFPSRQSVVALESEARDRWRTELDAESLRHVVRSHGSDYERVLAYRHGDPAWNTRVTPESPVILAQLLHGRDHEMAQTTEDLIWRRTELGPCGHASPAVTYTAQAVLDARPNR